MIYCPVKSAGYSCYPATKVIFDCRGNLHDQTQKAKRLASHLIGGTDFPDVKNRLGVYDIYDIGDFMEKRSQNPGISVFT